MQARPMDSQFSLDTITNLDALFDERARRSQQTLGLSEVHRGLVYGEGPGRTLNIFPARSGDALAPVHVYIHGGFWRSLDANIFSFLAPGFTPFGATLVVIDYPLMPGVRMAELVAACQDALAWVHANCGQYGGDSDRIFISGHSAGGQLVAELMDGAWLDARALPRDLIKGGAAISGIFDLEPITRSFQNDDLQFSDDEVSRFSPLRRPLSLNAPLIVAVGADETDEFRRQSADFAAHAAACGAVASHMEVAGTNHITVILHALADPNAPLNQAARAQMGL